MALCDGALNVVCDVVFTLYKSFHHVVRDVALCDGALNVVFTCFTCFQHDVALCEGALNVVFI